MTDSSYLDLSPDEVPLTLAELHQSLPVGAPVSCSFPHGSDEWLRDVFAGAGFDGVALSGDRVRFVEAVRTRTLPDFVAADMGVLVVGLNPSLHAADAGVGYVTPSNRFWRAALEVGLVTVDRDPWHAIRHHGVGMTDLVKRATRRADELRAAEFRDGVARVERLCERLRPGAVCVVGLAGWRTAVDRRATAGLQERRLGGRPVYLMPSTSGLNASSQLPDLIEHLRAVLDLGT